MNPFRQPRRNQTSTTTILSTTNKRRRRRQTQRYATNMRNTSNDPNRAQSLSLTKYRSNQVVERSLPGYQAMRYRAKLNYYDFTQVTSGAGFAGAHVYSANGLYDPDITSTGHQPMPFDQLMLSFEHYCVTNARITVNFRNQDTAYPLCVGISASATPTISTDYTALVENGLMVRSRILPVNNGFEIQDTLRFNLNIAKFGSVDDLLDNSLYHGSVSSNPSEQSYFQVSVWNPEDSTTHSASIEVFVEYDAWFFEPRQNSSSLSAKIMQLLVLEDRISRVETKRH